jgi:hypothetical protein
LLVLCVLSGLCDGLITRLEESYRLWCVLVCDLETSRMRRLTLIKGCKSRIEEEEEEELNSSTANQMCINENYSQAQKTKHLSESKQIRFIYPLHAHLLIR